MSRLLVTQYQSEVEKIIRYGGSKKETSIRNAFERLLNNLVDAYMEQLKQGTIRELNVKWDAETTQYLNRKLSINFQKNQVVESLYRPYIK